MKVEFYDANHDCDVTLDTQGPIQFIGMSIEFTSNNHTYHINRNYVHYIINDSEVLEVSYYSLNYNCPITLSTCSSISFREDGLEFFVDCRSGIISYEKMLWVRRAEIC